MSIAGTWLSAGVSTGTEQMHLIGHGDGSVTIITQSALDDLAKRDLAAYYDLIHDSPELWAAEWDWEHPLG